MTKYAFFLGCIAPLRYPGLEKSTRVVAAKLGIELVELEDASCCPAPGVIKSFSKDTWLAAAARNLALAEKQGLPIITICNGCYGSLFEAAHELNNHADVRAKANKFLKEIGMEYKGTTKVYHMAEVMFREVGIDKIKAKVTKPLDYKIATFYGCHFLKPSDIKKIDDPENPHMLDQLVEATGCVSVPRKQKYLCCGAGGGVRAAFGDVAKEFTKTNLENMKESGAKFIVDVCPFCHLQFDSSEKDLGFNIPVIHLSQLFGIAMGMSEKELGLSAHLVPVKL
ncbi:CoB--CoM heterodisulfide reductase subunit B [Candidatus Methanoplasma termitum]|uniref:HdrB2 protein n=1 Tax=Candidatus Methanoplasma termitum TaxID=1577791 RepID=A0A0A7LCG6_9ARCH|nr:CoB--CoM heterodisulfide reductase subunit B [Candidatus Methanoplasma termitum]AIZ56759.1 CoB--CoM heterodisulfide reductase subunit B [Candidatus Methanoplasma termitum]MCL2333973.1 CoB--CoM heterodisulfide reductase subunit B [Candidatus Methanoplasma sp.]